MNRIDIKTIVTDLDGTLLKDDKSISTHTETVSAIWVFLT